MGIIDLILKILFNQGINSLKKRSEEIRAEIDELNENGAQKREEFKFSHLSSIDKLDLVHKEMVRLDLIDPLTEFEKQEMIRSESHLFRDSNYPDYLIVRLFGTDKRSVWRDGESGMVPPDYNNIVPEIFELVKDLVSNYSVKLEYERIEDADDNYMLQLEIDGKEHLIELRDHGDYYDIKSIMDFFNNVILVDVNSKFLSIDTDDQSFIIYRGKSEDAIKIYKYFGLEEFCNFKFS